MTRFQMPLAAAFGFLGVALGAFGAHGFEPHLARLGTAEHWATASDYHLVHAAVLVALAGRTGRMHAVAWWCIAVGLVIFSGSLYILAASGVRAWGAVTPFGGLFLLAGWLTLAIASRPQRMDPRV